MGLVALAGVVTTVLLVRSGDGSGAVGTTVAPSPAPVATTSLASTSAAPSTAPPATAVETTAPPTTLPYGLPAVFPSTVPPDVCTTERIIADTGQTLGIDAFCRGGWSVNMASAECGECESVDVYRWTGERWVYRGNFYSFCISTLTSSGLPPAIAKEVGIDASETCKVDITLRPEPAVGPLSVSDEGLRVKRLQQALIDRGLLFDDADGQYGPNTSAAVTDLQYFLGLDPDGTAGPEVHAALLLPYD